ncbi:MAG: response regulator [Treponema sp.]|nr:response regulator [Treponema sp.]
MTHTTKGKKILIVDDDEFHLDFAEIVLKEEYEIFKAKSGSEALTYLCKNNFVPSLILLDILMPNMDGWEVFNRIKAISLLRNVPIIFLTSVTETSQEKRAFEIGAADYITKPYDKDYLRDRIKETIKKYESEKRVL